MDSMKRMEKLRDLDFQASAGPESYSTISIVNSTTSMYCRTPTYIESSALGDCWNQ